MKLAQVMNSNFMLLLKKFAFQNNPKLIAFYLLFIGEDVVLSLGGQNVPHSFLNVNGNASLCLLKWNVGISILKCEQLFFKFNYTPWF